MKRQRGRNRNNNNNNNKNNNPNRSLDSNGPDVKVRGSASHIHDKYVTLARDATSSGHRVKAENYLQHAEHYLRIVNAQEAAKQAAREEREAREAAQQAKHEGHDESENKGGRRGNRNRHNRHDEKDETGTTETTADAAADDKPKREPRKVKAKSDPAGLDVVDPKAKSKSIDADNAADAPVEAASEQTSIEAPKRRRRAPARKKAEDAVDAAE